MGRENISIDSIVAGILDSGSITKERVKKDITKIEDPFDVLDYIDRVRTFVELDLVRNGAIKIEESFPSLLSEVQQKAIKSAREKSERDGLTGLYNRGMVESNMRQPKEKYAVLMLDIDNFKKINDTYGHLIGDLVIKNVARTIQENLRESFIGRYGGEEFYVELNQTDKEGGRIAAERIRKKVEEKAIEYVISDLQRIGMEMPKKLADEKITISIGVADETQGKKPYDVRVKADEALYKAKQSGKNTVVVNGQLNQ